MDKAAQKGSFIRLSRKGIFLGNFFCRIYIPANGPVDFRSGHTLSAGRSWSLLGALAPVGSPVTSDPAGVECPPLQSTGSQNNLEYCNTLFLSLHSVLQSFFNLTGFTRRACSPTILVFTEAKPMHLL
jgi:hypothetical protein